MEENASIVTSKYYVLDGNGTDARMVTIFLRKQLNVATFSTSRLRHTESCGNETRI